MNISVLLGKTLLKCERSEDKDGDDGIQFETADEKYVMLHYQDCCEGVYIEDICGDLVDLVGSPILLAEESSNQDDEPPEGQGGEGSYTWTFYKLATVKGSVTIRWFGESNGYYSEEVDFVKV